MAVFYNNGSTGDNTRSYVTAQNPATPWQTPEEANGSAVAGDTAMHQASTVFPVDGATHFSLTRPFIHIAVGTVVWEPLAGETTFGSRISGSMTDEIPSSFNGFTFTSGPSTLAERVHVQGNNAARDVSASYIDCDFTTTVAGASSVGFRADTVRGFTTLTGGTISGIAMAAIQLASAAGSVAAAPYAFTSTGGTINLSGNTESTCAIIAAILTNGTKLSAPTAVVSDLTATSVSTGVIAERGIIFDSWDSVAVSDSDITVTAATTNENIGLSASGGTLGLTASVTYTNVDLTFNCQSGHGLRVGHSTNDSNVTTSSITGGSVTGLSPELITGTPHNATVGKDLDTVVSGFSSRLGYVGILASITGACDINGSTFRDHNGPYIYSKGTQGGQARNNTCYASDAFTQQDRAILANEVQDGPVNSTDFTYDSNIVYVSDISKIHGLASVGASQTGIVFTTNTYYLPNDAGIDPDVDLLFGLASTTMNSTINDWLGTYPTENIDFTRYTKAQIDNIISEGTTQSPQDQWSRLQQIGVNGKMYTYQDQEKTLGEMKDAFFSNQYAASRLKTDDVLTVNGLDGTNIYTLTVNQETRAITLSTGLSIV